MANRKVSSAEDEREAEFMNVEVSKEHYEKLLILSALWKDGSPRRMVEAFADSAWTQLDEFIPDDLTLEDFQGLAAYLQEA